MNKTNIDNPKDIEQLLQRFMDGLTSVEEEHRLGDYFRQNDVPEEWSAYKEMFAFFDEGMPQGRYDEPRKQRNRRPVALWTAFVAVAAAVALFFIMLPKVEPTTIAKGPECIDPLPDSVKAEPGEAATDSLITPEQQPKQPQRRSYYKHKYEPAPPKTYYAKAAPEPEEDPMAEADRLVAEQLNTRQLTQQAMMLHVDATVQAQGAQALLATYDDIDDLPENN